MLAGNHFEDDVQVQVIHERFFHFPVALADSQELMCFAIELVGFLFAGELRLLRAICVPTL